jgi:O-acetyl-ADP-ribose deacetylase (regulator of RNase III)
MKITEIQGDLFADLKPGEAFAHGANCEGVMGAGIAKTVRAEFPDNYRIYRKACRGGSFYPGDALVVYEKETWVYNLGTQYFRGADAKVENVRVSVKSMINDAWMREIKQIKTVRLGCGIGGLDWAEVKPVLEEIHTDIELIVYYF